MNVTNSIEIHNEPENNSKEFKIMWLISKIQKDNLLEVDGYQFS